MYTFKQFLVEAFKYKSTSNLLNKYLNTNDIKKIGNKISQTHDHGISEFEFKLYPNRDFKVAKRSSESLKFIDDKHIAPWKFDKTPDDFNHDLTIFGDDYLILVNTETDQYMLLRFDRAHVTIVTKNFNDVIDYEFINSWLSDINVKVLGAIVSDETGKEQFDRIASRHNIVNRDNMNKTISTDPVYKDIKLSFYKAGFEMKSLSFSGVNVKYFDVIIKLVQKEPITKMQKDNRNKNKTLSAMFEGTETVIASYDADNKMFEYRDSLNKNETNKNVHPIIRAAILKILNQYGTKLVELCSQLNDSK